MRAALLSVTLSSCLMAGGAAASCEDDLAAARAATIAAGPVRIVERAQTYDNAGKAAGSSLVVRDVIPPDRLRLTSILENGNTSQMLLVGASGWTGTLGNSRTPVDAAAVKQQLVDLMAGFPWPAGAKQVSCATEHDESGRQVTEFNFSFPAADNGTTFAVMVDPDSRRASRLTLTLLKGGARTLEVTKTFDYDALITIEPPS
jgi:hypothetical protein